MRWNKLELAASFVFYGKLVGLASFIAQYLEVNGVAAALETRHDTVVRCKAMAVVP